MKLHVHKVKSALNDLTLLQHKSLRSITRDLSNGHSRLEANILPAKGGVYVFWWTGNRNLLIDSNINRKLKYVGPNGRNVEIEYSVDWIEQITQNENIPLYVGKTADSLNKRISQHLQLGAKRGLPIGAAALNEKRMTTSNQLRDRIERMFIESMDTRSLILDNVGLSYVLMDGDQESVNRFFLEDKTIGEFYPLFNLDIER